MSPYTPALSGYAISAALHLRVRTYLYICAQVGRVGREPSASTSPSTVKCFRGGFLKWGLNGGDGGDENLPCPSLCELRPITQGSKAGGPCGWRHLPTVLSVRPYRLSRVPSAGEAGAIEMPSPKGKEAVGRHGCPSYFGELMIPCSSLQLVSV